MKYLFKGKNRFYFIFFFFAVSTTKSEQDPFFLKKSFSVISPFIVIAMVTVIGSEIGKMMRQQRQYDDFTKMVTQNNSTGYIIQKIDNNMTRIFFTNNNNLYFYQKYINFDNNIDNELQKIFSPAPPMSKTISRIAQLSVNNPSEKVIQNNRKNTEPVSTLVVSGIDSSTMTDAKRAMPQDPLSSILHSGELLFVKKVKKEELIPKVESKSSKFYRIKITNPTDHSNMFVIDNPICAYCIQK